MPVTKTKSQASVVTMDARKFLRLVNESAQAKISIFESLIGRISEKTNSNFRLVALGNGTLVFENADTHQYYRANYIRKKGRVSLENIARIKVVEEGKGKIFSKAVMSLVESVCDDDLKAANKHLDTIGHMRFKPRVIPESGMIRTRDGVVRKISVESPGNDHNRIIGAVVSILSDKFVIRDGQIVEATLHGKRTLNLPINELIRRKIIAREMKQVASKAYLSEAFQSSVHGWAAQVSHGKLDSAVKGAAEFLREYQEFCMLSADETKVLIENALAACGSMNDKLSTDVTKLFHAVNLRINRKDICEAWHKAAVKAEDAELMEAARKLEESSDKSFAKDYGLFLESIFVENESREVRVQAITNAIKIILSILRKEEEPEEELEPTEPEPEYEDLDIDLGAEDLGAGEEGRPEEEFKLENRRRSGRIIAEEENTETERAEVIEDLEALLARLEETGDEASVYEAEKLLANLSDALVAELSGKTGAGLKDFDEIPGEDLGGPVDLEGEGEDLEDLGDLDIGLEDEEEGEGEGTDINVNINANESKKRGLERFMDVAALREEYEVWRSDLRKIISEGKPADHIAQLALYINRAKDLGGPAEAVQKDFARLIESAKTIIKEMGMCPECICDPCACVCADCDQAPCACSCDICDCSPCVCDETDMYRTCPCDVCNCSPCVCGQESPEPVPGVINPNYGMAEAKCEDTEEEKDRPDSQKFDYEVSGEEEEEAASEDQYKSASRRRRRAQIQRGRDTIAATEELSEGELSETTVVVVSDADIDQAVAAVVDTMEKQEAGELPPSPPAPMPPAIIPSEPEDLEPEDLEPEDLEPEDLEEPEEMVGEDKDMCQPGSGKYDTEKDARKDGSGKKRRPAPKFSHKDYDGS